MTRSRDGGFSLWNILGIVVAVVIVVGISLFVVFNHYYNHYYTNVAKVNFNITHLSLSEQERAMIRPMVNNVLEKLNQEANIAEAVDLRLLVRTDITPYNAEEAITDFRSARKATWVAHRRLDDACGAAKYFHLVERNLEWCK